MKYLQTAPLLQLPLVSSLAIAFAAIAGCGAGSSTPPAAPVASLSTSSLTFPSTLINTTSSAMTVTLTNTGNAALTLSSETIAGTNAASFAIGANTCGTTSLAASAACTISLTFTPSSVAGFSATLSIADNGTGSPQTVALSGAGVLPTATLTPATVAFPTTTVGLTATAIAATLTNTSTAVPLTIGGVTLTGTNAGAFAISSSTCGSTLAVGAQCMVSVTFKPTSATALTATLSIADNAASSPQTAALTGTGTLLPTPTLSPSVITFPATADGITTSPMSATLTNNSTAPLNLSSIAITGTNASAFSIVSNGCNTVLAASAQCIVQIAFTPAAAGSLSATLSIADNAVGSPQTLALLGTGDYPTLTVTPSPIAFPLTGTATTSSAMAVTVANTGPVPATFSSISITGANPNLFSIVSNGCGTTLAISAQCIVQIAFSPTTTGPFSASLSIAGNAFGSPQTIPITGTAAAATITVSPSTLAFGANLALSTDALPVTVTNTSNVAAAFTGLTVTGTNASAFSITPGTCASTLAAMMSCTLIANFNPPSVASYSASINIADSAQGSPQILSATGSGALEPNSCTTTNTTSPAQSAPTASYPGTAFSGKVMAGFTPVIGASVQIYAAGQTGNGSAPTALLATPLTTNSSGAFTVPASFTCPYNNSVLYAVARGGQAGSTGAVNAGIVLASVLGTCNSIAGSSTFTINEATTATMAWSMQPFMALGGKMGATATNSAGSTYSSGIVLAAGTFANLINPLSGTSPGTYFPATGTAPIAKIDQLANLLDACIVSTGASSSTCTQLYNLTATSAGTPNNTLDAVLNLVRNPGTNVAALYTLSAGSIAYSPVLTAAPADWTLYVTYSGGGMNDPSAVSLDSTGRLWVANYFNVASLFTNTGAPILANGITGDNLYNSYGGAVDVNDVEWIVNEESSGFNSGLGSLTPFTSSGMPVNTYTAGGINFPLDVAFDTSGLSWVVDYGDSSVTILTNSGTPVSGANGYTSPQYIFPVALATDAKCNAYITNQSSNTLTFTSANGAIFGSFVMGSSSSGVGPSGITVDTAGNIWSANYYGNSVGLLSPSGVVLSGGGYTGGGIEHPQGIAADGSGNIWVANYRGIGISELAGASAATPGAPLSPTNGWGADAGLLEPFSLAIDAGGSIWISNFGTNTITEFIGAAAPVETPLIGPVRVP